MREMPYIQPYHVGNRRGGNQNIRLMMLNLAMFMLQLMLNIMIMLNYLKNGLVVI